MELIWSTCLDKASDIIVTIEDHVLNGGYGSIVRDHLADQNINTPVIRIGWPDKFIEHASSVDYLRKKHGLTGEVAAEKIKQVIGNNNKELLSIDNVNSN